MSTDLQTAMEKLLQKPGICAESRALIELAMEAQESGTMPDLTEGLPQNGAKPEGELK